MKYICSTIIIVVTCGISCYLGVLDTTAYASIGFFGCCVASLSWLKVD